MTFNKGDRVGLIGPNGAGKTTLLRIMTGDLKPDQGKCEWSPDTRIGYLQQESLEVTREQTVRGMVMEAFSEANDIEKKIESITNEIAALESYEDAHYEKLLSRLESLQSRYDMLSAGKRDARVEEALKGLGFSSAELDDPLHTFSGGWQMRALLAKLLLEAPDILLLDEPTNHLDIDSIDWLERYLPGYPGAIWIVSHDQMFLNRMVTHIASLEHRKLKLYTGNYEDYERQYEQQFELQQQSWENQQKEIEQAERFINRFRAKATKARQVQSKIKQLEKMDRIEMPEVDNSSIDFRFPDPPRCGVKVMDIYGLSKTYMTDRQQPVPVFTENQDISIERGDKIALIGANGAGKSTLARIINGTEPFDGERVTGHNVIMTFFAQHLADVLTSERTVLEEMELSAKSSEARTRIRGILGAFLFSGDDVFKKVGVLSGGERSRLALAKSLLEPANLLILDEPTNHLDIRSKKVLLRALDQYQGTVIAVSHDRYFLDGFANKVWRVGNGRLFEYPGDFSYYEWKVKQQSAEDSADQQNTENQTSRSTPAEKAENRQSAAAQGSGNGQSNTSGPKSREVKRMEAELRNRFSSDMKPLKKRLASLEEEISTMEEEKTKIEEKLADPAFYESGDAGDVLQRHSDLERRLGRSWDSWADVTTELEKLQEKFDSALKEVLSGNQ
ncbi:ABC-F family ATP-binding cassette domain-containing protein [Natronogracilivirga saccharolytica]|uniref:ABC-F family ATP-binding cassette domain-containing protein n=1 Tax=Natronogracilivirga saccharolytica TaxID=2812953 RepID=A0A8J7RK31_9BACT|nr:ABC-F family ATP-binding cassette domain-containing protein [Natronogracilivirga saccharolytica]MBP3191104.1 ABC-F family ATP-binding cassette domain-containing protein [Natronogracilivirga saccharolytica]